jgi:ribonuclease PH
MTQSIRKIKITPNYVSSGEGSVLFEMGNTRVLCVATVTEDNVPKFCEEKKTGWITAEYAMLPRSGKQRTNRNKIISSGRTHEIQRLIGRSLRAVVDLEKLGKRTILIDCDVIQADGGTRVASINGSYIVLTQVVNKLIKDGKLDKSPIRDTVGAISVGIVEGKKVLDLSADKDTIADVDMNVVMTGTGKFIEVQSTAEKIPFSQHDLNSLIDLAKKGIQTILKTSTKYCK